MSALLEWFGCGETHLAVDTLEDPAPLVILLLHEHVAQFGWDGVEAATVHYDDPIFACFIVMFQRLIVHELWFARDIHLVGTVTHACSDYLLALEPIWTCRVDQQPSGFAQPVHGCFVGHFGYLYRYFYLLLLQHCL